MVGPRRLHPPDLDERGLLLAGALAEQEEQQQQHEPTGGRDRDEGLLLVVELALQAALSLAELRLEVIA